MSTSRVLSRLAAASSVALAILAVAAPAYAADAVDVNISGLSGSVTAGARPDSFTVRLQNQTKEEIQPVRRIFVIRLAGLSPDALRLTRGLQALHLQPSGTGEIRAVDTLQGRLGPEGTNGDSLTTAYTIGFLSGAPAGKADVIVEAYRVVPGGAEQRLGGDSTSVTVRGGQPASTTASTKTPPSTAPVVLIVPTFAPGPTFSLAPPDDNRAFSGDDGGAGIPLIFYVMGAALVGAGAAMLWLLFRPRPEPSPAGYPTGDYLQTTPYQAGHATRPLYPTAILPAVRDSHLPPPAADPWATPGRPDDTRELRPFDGPRPFDSPRP